MIKRTTARTLALLLALLSVFLFLSGCAKKPEPIMYDDEFQGCLSVSSIQCSYADMFQIYESIEESPDRSQLACIPCILEFSDLIPYETVLASSAGNLADFVMVYHAKIVFDFALGSESVERYSLRTGGSNTNAAPRRPTLSTGRSDIYTADNGI